MYTGGGGADNLTGGTGNDIFNLTGQLAPDTDTIADFDATSGDTITFSLAHIELGATVDDFTSANLTSPVATDAITYLALASDGAVPGDVDVVGIIGDYANATAALAAKASWTIGYGAAATANDGMLVAYTSGSDVRIAIIENTATATSDGIDGMRDVLILQNVSLSDLDSADFNVLGA